MVSTAGLPPASDSDSDLRSARFRCPRPARRGLILVLIVTMSVTATGCLVGPNYKPPFMILPAHWDGIDEVAKPMTGEIIHPDIITGPLPPSNSDMRIGSSR